MKIVNKLLLITFGTALVALSVGTPTVAQTKFQPIETHSEAYTFCDFNNGLPEGLGFFPEQSKNYNISDPDHSNFVFNNSINQLIITLASKPSSINNILNFRIDTDKIINSFLVFNCLIVITLCVLEVLLIVDQEWSN
ncbi:hypothetical protein ACP6PL_20475 [Dapis sp. BLCC M126]|uniref:hypothetical protein n=1 Tax=Dapis sp. BLCC M126 TaxID=3400189 RepID=UPI003CFB8F76